MQGSEHDSAIAAASTVGKVIIQIPCYNEETSLPETLSHLPRELPGVDAVEWLVIDDGSDDGTAAVAAEHGTDHVLRLPHRGLASAFAEGLDRAVDLGADIIVNTDGDNQYDARDIPALLAPIRQGRAEMVVGARSIDGIEHFGFIKKLLLRLGSWVVRLASGVAVCDAPSGFRAFSRRAAMVLNVTDPYTYTLETIIQAGQKGVPVVSVPVRTNPAMRNSRLVTSTLAYVLYSARTIIRVCIAYKPQRFFMVFGLLVFLPGLVLGLRYLAALLTSSETGGLPDLLVASLFIGSAFLLVVQGFVAELVAVNRRLLEDLRYRQRSHRGREGTSGRDDKGSGGA